jgi:transcriptional regulator with XRE-family HTH domain
VQNPRLQNYLRTYRKRYALSQADIANLLGANSGTKVSRYENFTRAPGPLTTFALLIIFNRPAADLFAGTYDAIRQKIRQRARRMMKELNARPGRQTKKTLRKIELLSAIVEAKPNGTRRS